MKTNKIYIVCPFSQMEEFIRNNIDNNAYFITGAAGRINFDDMLLPEILSHIILREKIKEIIIVNDINCMFIDNVLNNKISYPNKAYNFLKKLISDYREAFPSTKPIEERRHLLAKLNINDHSREIKSNSVLKYLFTRSSIKISGIIANRFSKYTEPLTIM